MSEQKKKLVAYHEAGHAILGALMRHGRNGLAVSASDVTRERAVGRVESCILTTHLT